MAPCGRGALDRKSKITLAGPYLCRPECLCVRLPLEPSPPADLPQYHAVVYFRRAWFFGWGDIRVLSFEQSNIPTTHVARLVETDCVALGNPLQHMDSAVQCGFFDAGKIWLQNVA